MSSTQHNSAYPDAHNIAQYTFYNGITLLVFENFASQTVVIEGVIRAGALRELDAQEGLAAFTAGMLLRGTASSDYTQINETLESIGADLMFSGGYHTTSVSAHCLAEDTERVMAMIAAALRTPTFPDEQIARLRGQILTGLQLQADDTGQRAMQAFRQHAYPQHPYGRSRQGTFASIPALTRDDLVNFHAAHYGPRRMILTFVGAITAGAAQKLVADAFGDWEAGMDNGETAVPDAPAPAQHIVTVPMPHKAQTDIVMGLPGPRRSAPDYLEASLMNTILGVFGMMGRIGLAVREKQGLAYYAYSQLRGGLGPTPWLAYAGVAPENVSQTIQTLRDEIARMQNEPVAAEELADCQAYRIGALPVGLETNSGIADVITDMALYDLGMDYLRTFPAQIRAITPAHIQAAAQRYLQLDEMVTAVAGAVAPVGAAQL